jgi:hypothetical protein
MDLATVVSALERLPEIADRLERIEECVRSIEKATPIKRYVDIRWICTELGCSRDWLRTRPWVLPNFGQSEVSGSPRRWKLDTWRAWAEDLSAREQAWRAMSAVDRNRVTQRVA